MREIMRWPLWLSLLVFALDLSIILAIWASLGNLPTLITALVLVLVSTYFYMATSLTLELNSTHFRAGRAKIEIEFLKDAKALSRQEMLFYRGVGIDPRAYLSIRFWIKDGLKIEISDSRDPTPYWLISAKNPDKFVEKLNS